MVGSDLDSIVWSTAYLFDKNGVFQKQQSFRQSLIVTPNTLYSTKVLFHKLSTAKDLSVFVACTIDQGQFQMGISE
jgi:hypothetical protein